MYQAVAPPQVTVTAARRPQQIPTKDNKVTKGRNINVGFGGKRKEQLWQCVEGCGACCKLAKGPSFASPEEIFQNTSDIELYKSLIGPDGWCIHYEKNTRKCSIYADRPYFCRVESPVFDKLYGIKENKFNKAACSSCRDTIKAVYGFSSKELENFNKAVQSSESVVLESKLQYNFTCTSEDKKNGVWHMIATMETVCTRDISTRKLRGKGILIQQLEANNFLLLHSQ